MRRQLKYYIKTSHDQLDNSDTLIKSIESLLTKQTALTQNEQDDLRRTATEALARLDYHKTTGQNFLGSNKFTDAEQEYQTLQRLTLTSALRLNTDLTILRTDQNYKSTLLLCKEGRGDKEQYNNQ